MSAADTSLKTFTLLPAIGLHQRELFRESRGGSGSSVAMEQVRKLLEGRFISANLENLCQGVRSLRSGRYSPDRRPFLVLGVQL